MAQSMRPHTARRSVAAALLILVLVIAISMRVIAVNATALQYPSRDHALGDTVSLDGSYAEFKRENTDGLEVTVTGAHRMSCAEYLEQYVENDDLYIPYTDDMTDMNAKTLVVLDMTITSRKKPSDERGYLDSLGWSVVPDAARERWLRVDSALFDATIPQAEGSYQLSVKPGTSFVVHVPFDSLVNRAFPAKATETYRPTVDAGSFTLTMTNAPVRHTVSFSIP